MEVWYVFTVFAVKPEDLIDERIESFSLTADPIKYGYVASEGTMLFSDDLKISSFILFILSALHCSSDGLFFNIVTHLPH